MHCSSQVHRVLVQTSSQSPDATSAKVLILDAPPDKSVENEQQNQGNQGYPPASMCTTIPAQETATRMDTNRMDECRAVLLAFRRMPVRDKEGVEEESDASGAALLVADLVA
jgi:hypothetical protein